MVQGPIKMNVSHATGEVQVTLTGDSHQRRKKLRELYRTYRYVQMKLYGGFFVKNTYICWN
jgi:hypothetical protein